MVILNSPITGKPMRLVYKPDTIVFRGEKYPITYLSYRDDESGDSFTTTESDSIWHTQMTNQYREKHGIPYQDEIIALRERYGVSAAKMAQILGFGTNQYRLYEEGEVPSESNGKTIRSAMNPRTFRELLNCTRQQLSDKEYDRISAKVEEAIWRYDSSSEEMWKASWVFQKERGKDNGYAPQSVSRLKNLLLYVLDRMGGTFQTKLNKVLFYIDFLSYRERGIAISGLAYNAIEFGPVPQRWNRVYSAFDEVTPLPKMVKEQERTILTASAKADMSMFTDKEIALIDTVCAKLKRMSATKASDFSHQESAWQNHHNQSSPIPFEEAFNLKLF